MNFENNTGEQLNQTEYENKELVVLLPEALINCNFQQVRSHRHHLQTKRTMRT